MVFGAGKVGAHLARILLDRGDEFRVAKRSPAGSPAGAGPVLGDAADPAFCTAAVNWASTVYHCLNPPYVAKVWAELVPRYMTNLVEASARAGARLVVLGRVPTTPDPEERPGAFRSTLRLAQAFVVSVQRRR